MKTLSVTEARADLSGVIARAKSGSPTMIFKNSLPDAAVVAPEVGEIAPMIVAILRELGLSLEMSNDAELVAAYRIGQEEFERGEIVWDDL